jgi:hypothetical protein
VEQLVEIAQIVGTALGAAAATAAAVWGALVRPMRRQLNEATEAARAPDPKVAVLESKLAEALRRLDKIEDRTNKSVTDDEFEAYTSTTNKSVQALTEKIGSATGAIEAWYRLNNQGR